MWRRRDKKPAHYKSTDFRFNIRNYMSYSKFIVVTTTLLFLLGGSYYAFFMTPIYEAVAVAETQSYSPVRELIGSNPVFSSVISTDPSKEVELIKSSALTNQVMAKLNNQSSKSMTVQTGMRLMTVKPKINHHTKNLLAAVKVEMPAEKSSLILIALKGQNPQEITYIVNTIAETAVELSQAYQQKQLTQLRTVLQKKQSTLQQFITSSQKSIAINKSEERREVENAKTLEKKISQQIIDVDALAALQMSNLQLHFPAEVPLIPVSYSRLVIILLSLVFGLLIGYVLAIALD